MRKILDAVLDYKPGLALAARLTAIAAVLCAQSDIAT